MKTVAKRLSKRLLVFAHDIAWVPATIVAAYWLRFNLSAISQSMLPGIVELTSVAMVVQGFALWAFGCYRGIWRFASIPDLVRLLKAVVVGAFITTVICFMIGRLQTIPRSVLVLYPMLLVGVLSAARVAYRAVKDWHYRLDVENGTRALLVGAGRAGELLIRDMERHLQIIPVAFVDDDSTKYGQEVRGVRIRGTIDDIPMLLEDLSIGLVLITMPSAPRNIMDKVVEFCAARNVQCRTLPTLAELADGRIEVSRLRPVTVEDLLGRDPVELNPQSVDAFLLGKRILVTGGGGSIGSELCRQIGKHEPGLLIIVDNCEYNLYRIEQEIRTSYPSLLFNCLLCDVRNYQVIERIFENYKPQIVFHAAAYKHVPLVEDNILEGIRNNVFGTQVVADLAKKHHAGTFVLISTDKTVNPTNVMGTTKRVAELYCQMVNESASTHFITTRFGNVLGSAGSVVPHFKRQIESGGPVTVTHPEVTRYFMTIPEAASLILQGGAIGRGGEIFVLDMGEPVRIRDLAEKLIQLSGLQPGRDIHISYIGLRPGEKLHEELFYTQETLRTTVHPKLMLASCEKKDIDQIEGNLEELNNAIHHHNQELALNVLRSLVPEFQHSVSLEERRKRQLLSSRLQVVK